MVRKLSIAFLALSTLVLGSAHAESLVATVTAMVHLALSPTATTSAPIEAAYFSNDLKRFEKHIDDAHWQDFNADPITGAQETPGVTVAKVSQSGNIVTVAYSSDGGKTVERRIGYAMVEQDGAWKVNDIIYGPLPGAPGGSFRKMMTANVKN